MISPWPDNLWLAPLALFLDLVFGDPKLPWRHPVCAIGAFLDWQERYCRVFMERGATPAAKQWRGRLAGFLAVCLTAGAAGGMVLALCILPYIGVIFAIYFAWAGLAMGCLLKTGDIALERVESGSAKEAREGVGWLVSRDVSQMDQKTLRKTLADTLSENYTDAFLAPFFWLIIGGPACLWFYKAISTMDSQWGYITPRWKNIGFAPAKADDLMAWLPARVSSLAFFLTHKIAGLMPKERSWRGGWPGFAAIARQAKGMPSPNSGWPMTACAWLCQRRMAGPCVYFGEYTPKPWLGPAKAPDWDKISLRALRRLLFQATITGAALLWLAAFMVKLLFFG